MMSARYRPGKVREPSPRHGHTAVVVGDHAYLWGGMRLDLPTEHSSVTKKKMTSTIDVFSLVTGLWAQQETAGDPPLGVAGYACAAIRKDIYYFGGLCGHGNCYHNSVHHLGANTLHWTLVRAANSADAPIKKWGSGMVVLEEDGEALLLVVGGFGDVPTQSDASCRKFHKSSATGGWTREIHLFRPKLGTWRDTTVCGEPIPSMYAFTLTKIASNRAVLYGGYPVDGLCSQKVYMLEYVEKEMYCHEQKIRSHLRPTARQNHIATCIHCMTDHMTPLLLVAGGEDCQLASLSDCWLLNLESWEWKRVAIPENVVRRTSSSVSAFQIGPGCVWLLFFGGLSGYLTDKDVRHQPMMAKTELLELRQERNGKWAASWIASTCTTIADNVHKHLTNTVIGKRSEWMEAMTSTVECLQRQVSDGVRQGDKKVQEVSQKLQTVHQRQIQEKESELAEAKKTIQSVSLQVEDLTSQLSLAQLQEDGLKQVLAQWREKAGTLEGESQVASHLHQEEIAQLKQRLQAAEGNNTALLSNLQQLEKQLLEMEQLNESLRRDKDSRETPSKQAPSPTVERSLPVLVKNRSSGFDESYLPSTPPPQVSLRLFQTEVIYRIPNRWFEFGINVEVGIEDIRRIENLYKDPVRLFVEVYCMWKMNVAPPLSWLTIVNTLELMNERKLSKELREKYAIASNA